MERVDLSFFLAHFTADGTPYRKNADNPAFRYKDMSAKDKLISILQGKKITASHIPHLPNIAGVCFTECPWTSLIAHARQYSPFGVGFTKAHIFAAGGGPAFYMRQDIYNSQQWDRKIHAFITPFRPFYTPPSYRGENFQILDFSHEREWRIPHDFVFEHEDVQFVVLNNYNDMESFPQDLKDSIGCDKFILMENYEKIEQLWPVHRLITD